MLRSKHEQQPKALHAKDFWPRQRKSNCMDAKNKGMSKMSG